MKKRKIAPIDRHVYFVEPRQLGLSSFCGEGEMRWRKTASSESGIKTKTAPKKKLFPSKKIVVGLSKSVYRFYEPVVPSDTDVCDEQTNDGNKGKQWLNTLLRKLNSSG